MKMLQTSILIRAADRCTDGVERFLCSRGLKRAIWWFLCFAAGYFGVIVILNIINR